MVKFIYHCPRTGAQVEGQQAEPGIASAGPLTTYVAEFCPACRGLHIVNPATGALLSKEASRPLASTARPLEAALGP